ncbi:oxidoreductase [Mucilaginibacter lacusdianchii]|uniref:oxidoreductase n=1 Tax=Mucilaginibacter lacusdianchii TaxID=2684211 RepID=UPI00131B5E99|nr:oxidoreductase [Mucilaginibacter sp. JXJ CY 39]
MTTINKTWLITGCSSGLGRAQAEEVLKKGYNAVITSRKVQDVQSLADQYPETALALALDITDQEQITTVIQQAEARFGRIDVLMNNAGYGYRAAVEEGDDEDVRNLFDTLFFGTVNMIKSVLPGMRSRKSGTILVVSSIGGRFSQPASGYYSAAKFALEGMSDALRKEVAPLGIRTIVIEPGAFRTDFAGRSLQGAKTEIADYAETVGPRRKENDKSHGTQPGDPQKAARTIIEITESEKIPFRLLLGSDAIQTITKELDAQKQELEDWKGVSLTTDYEQ